jgi:2-dehydro-3-deoxygluconokinase
VNRSGRLAFLGEGLAELALAPNPDDDLRLGFGGDAANLAVMAAGLGAPALLVGRVGADPLGARLVSFWQRRGVDLSYVRTDPVAPTGLYINQSDPRHGHKFTYLRRGSAGSRWRFTDADADLFSGLRVLTLTGVTLSLSKAMTTDALLAADHARAAGAKIATVINFRTALSPDPKQLAAVARESEFVFVSVEDAQAVFGTSELDALQGHLPSVCELVVTNGALDALVAHHGAVSRHPVPRVDVRNAAGAGDALAGAYLAARVRHRLDPAGALAWGVAAASWSVQRDGCAASYPQLSQTRSQLTRLAEHKC